MLILIMWLKWLGLLDPIDKLWTEKIYTKSGITNYHLIFKLCWCFPKGPSYLNLWTSMKCGHSGEKYLFILCQQIKKLYEIRLEKLCLYNFGKLSQLPGSSTPHHGCVICTEIPEVSKEYIDIQNKQHSPKQIVTKFTHKLLHIFQQILM